MLDRAFTGPRQLGREAVPPHQNSVIVFTSSCPAR